MRHDLHKLLLIGVPKVPHVGAFFQEAAAQLGLDALTLNLEAAAGIARAYSAVVGAGRPVVHCA